MKSEMELMREGFEKYMQKRLIQGDRGEIISGEDVVRACSNAPDYYYHRETQGRWAAWQAARQQAVPSGYVMVPVEPSTEMVLALDDALGPNGIYLADMVRAYKAMLAAAPQPSEGAAAITVEMLEAIWQDGCDAENYEDREDCQPLILARIAIEEARTAPPAPDVSGYLTVSVEALQEREEEIAGLVGALETVMYCRQAELLPLSVQRAASDALAAYQNREG